MAGEHLPSFCIPTVFRAVHDALDPEMSILKQRIARRLRHEGFNDESVKNLDLGACACCFGHSGLEARTPPKAWLWRGQLGASPLCVPTCTRVPSHPACSGSDQGGRAHHL